MKLSLSFQPFVKPIYKEFCIQKVQQTVSEIKSHFKFSNKQQIYQPQPIQTQTKNNTPQNIKTQNQMDRTVKNSFYQRDKSGCKNNIENTQKYQFTDSQREHSQKKYNNNRKLSNHMESKTQNQNKLQKQQLIEFLQKVQQTMKNHTQFYQNIIQKIELMNKKQLNLQKMIDQFNKLAYQKRNNHLKLQIMQSSQKLESQTQLASVTFRNNKFIDEDSQQKILCQKKSQLSKGQNQNIQKNYLTQIYDFPSFQKKDEEKLIKSNYFQQKQMKKEVNLEINQNKVSQSVDFLIGFMKLQQQFNKIKRKNQYKQFKQLMKEQI